MSNYFNNQLIGYNPKFADVYCVFFFSKLTTLDFGELTSKFSKI